MLAYVSKQAVHILNALLLLCKGRAGRVSKGYCYRLVCKNFWTNYIPESTVPEMMVRTAH